MHLFNKKREDAPDDGVVIVREPQPGTCGGTRATLDTKAPHEIASEDMVLFHVTSALGGMPEPRGPGKEPLGYISAFAAPTGKGTFLFFERGDGPRRGERRGDWALVKENVFPALVRLTRERELAKQNGSHSHTYGLPEDFGGSVCIRYAGGEKISFSNNQGPILSYETGVEIAALFEKAMRGERVPLPDLADLRQIRFSEEREGGGFTRAVLTLLPDGSGTNQKTRRFDDPKVYESEKPVDADTVAAIRTAIGRCGLLAWRGLPENGFATDLVKRKLAFCFADGTEIAVDDARQLPDQLQGGFFAIQLEMETKH